VTYVIDIDDTIFHSELTEAGKYRLIDADLDMISKINELFQDGHAVILYTGRHWNHLSQTKRDLERYGVDYTTLVMGKPVGDVYVDDKAMRPGEFLCQ